MKIGILTYDAQHLKTEQVAQALSINGNYELSFHALPFKERKPRDVLFAHRPDQSSGIHARVIAAAIDAPYRVWEDPNAIVDDTVDYWMITGSNLLPESFVTRYPGRIINGHPGLIPSVRGLDSFKWSIIDDQPLGLTLHFIDAEADSGEIISSLKTPIYRTDTMSDVARRHYEIEITMLANFERLIRDRPLVKERLDRRPARMRMPQSEEAAMIGKFDVYRDAFSVN